MSKNLLKLSSDEKILLIRDRDNTLSAAMLRTLAEDTDWYVRESVARHEKTPSAVLERLAYDPSFSVRTEVALNSHTPISTIATLGGDEIRKVALAAHVTFHLVLDKTIVSHTTFHFIDVILEKIDIICGLIDIESRLFIQILNYKKQKIALISPGDGLLISYNNDYINWRSPEKQEEKNLKNNDGNDEYWDTGENNFLYAETQDYEPALYKANFETMDQEKSIDSDT